MLSKPFSLGKLIVIAWKTEVLSNALRFLATQPDVTDNTNCSMEGYSLSLGCDFTGLRSLVRGQKCSDDALFDLQ